MTTKPTTKQISSYLQVVSLISQMVRSVGSIPAGHLYASCMNVMDLNTFNGIIGHLVGAGLVTHTGHVITWIGPK